MFTKLIVAATVFCSPALAQAQTKLTIASGARGNWETAAAELGQKGGFFKRHGLDVQVLWTQGSGETLQAVASGSADIGIGLGLAASMAAFLKGAPVRPIANASTGPDIYWYVPVASPIRSLKDAGGKTMAYSTKGSSSYMALVGLSKLYAVDVKPTGTGSPAATFTQVMSGQVDIGWAGPPFGIAQIRNGAIRVVAREAELPEFQDQTVRVMIGNLTLIKDRPDTLKAFRDAYAETIDWMYSDPEAVKAYSAFSGIAEDVALQVRDEFFPKKALALTSLSGVDAAMRDAVEMKFLREPLTKDQLEQFFAFYAK